MTELNNGSISIEQFRIEIDEMIVRFKRILHKPNCKTPGMRIRIIDQGRCGAITIECPNCPTEEFVGPHFGNAGQSPFGMTEVRNYAKEKKYKVIGPGKNKEE